MPFDIYTVDNHGGAEKLIWLAETDFFNVYESINNNSDYPLLNRTFADLYGEAEIYLDEIDPLRLEVVAVEKMDNEIIPERTIIPCRFSFINRKCS